jgi:diaminohydroxyphosphoribosylaminopyrimidine deaminase/5-amino-6-(5-phosphoribosylamino)uracil reductase
MARALELASRGWGRVAPNPLVGAVVLRNGELVGEGWHAEYGAEHAEPAALRAAGDRALGATLVVTLEPCAHSGKTPPCTDAIVAAGIRRVVIALQDPNPVAAGGIDLLRKAGVEVATGVAADEAAAQNAAFLHHIRGEARPFVALKLATSLDFRIADAGRISRWVSGPKAREYVHWLRAGFDAVAVGLGTAKADDPLLTPRATPEPRLPVRRVVFDRQLALPHTLRLVRDQPVSSIVLGEASASDDRARALEARGVRVIRAADAAAQLRMLRAENIGSLLVEGGGQVAGRLLADGLVDRFYWIQAPLWLGDAGVPAVRGLPSGPLADARRWRVVERRSLDDDTLLVVDRP